MKKKYVCEVCGTLFWSSRPDEEAQAERLVDWKPPPDDSEGVAVLCTDCYKEMLLWGRENGLTRASGEIT